MCSYDSELFSAFEDVKRRISFWQTYLRYVKDGMPDFDERAEYYIECVGRRVDYLADLSFLSHIESLKRPSAVAEGNSDDDDTDEESPRRRKPLQVRYRGIIMQRALKRARRTN